jgi:NAD(P)-dependent dehydrogenase (short-subunit alcohol dehydrogenase family)
VASTPSLRVLWPMQDTRSTLVCGQTNGRNAPQVEDVEEYAASQEVDIQVRVLANELRGRDITVNAVAPGPVGTELFITGKTEGQIGQLRRLSPLERLGQPEDISNVVSFLAGPDGGGLDQWTGHSC